jgi:hypothetical protein
MGQILKSIVHWLIDALPDISNLILVLVGVIMSMPKLAEKIEDHALARNVVGVGCVFLGLAGFVVSINQRRAATSQMGNLVTDVHTLVTNTNTLVVNTNTVALLVPSVSTLNARVADLNLKIDAAKGNPQLIAALQKQAKEAQTQADLASKRLIFAIVPGISNALYSIGNEWYLQDDILITQGATASYANGDPRKRVTLLSNGHAEFSKKYTTQAISLMPTADSLRQQLLEQLPLSAQTEEDKNEAKLFAKIKGGEGVLSGDLIRAGGYLRSLSQRVASANPAAP